jgi:hypothetical protein
LDSSFANKTISQRGHLIHKVSATDSTGKRAYYFILVLPAKEAEFLKSLKKGKINIKDYGEVIASCYGETPTEEVRQLLKEKYGFDVESSTK